MKPQELNIPPGSAIAIVGMGYVGKRLQQFLAATYTGTIECFNRQNIDSIKGKKFDYLFNCAGNTGDFRTQIWETVNSNIQFCQFLIENVTITRALVYLSSTRVYGFSENEMNRFSEEDEILKTYSNHLNTDFIYNGTKLLTESLLMNAAGKLPYSIIICRLSNVYGNYLKEDLDDSTYLKLLIRHYSNNKSIFISQNLYSGKDYIFIEDALKGIVAAAVKAPHSGIYNIASGKSYCLIDWLQFLNLSFELQNENSPAVYSNINIEKAKKDIDFVPEYSLNNLSLTQIITL